MKRYYLAYGSNLNVWQMALRCPTAKAVGTAVIKDYELLFKGSKTGSYLTIEPKLGAEVPVAVWSVEPKDEFSLDRYEGYPTFYYKRELPVLVTPLDGGAPRELTAMVYIMDEKHTFRMPSLYYYDVLYRGYRAFGFDLNLLRQGIEDSMGSAYADAIEKEHRRAFL